MYKIFKEQIKFPFKFCRYCLRRTEHQISDACYWYKAECQTQIPRNCSVVTCITL